MIKLKRDAAPDYLSSAKVVELTQEFRSTGKSVWNHDSIKTPLMNSSYKKCAYCECCLDQESNYMEVEHFEDKDTYPDKVVAWSNLLPSCKRCNAAKGTHNVFEEPIINPYIDEPNKHLVFKLYRFLGATTLGRSTEAVVDLNNSERVVRVRFDIGEALEKGISAAREKLELYRANKITFRKNRLLGSIRGLLEQCQPNAAYAALAATLVTNDDNFIGVMDGVISEGLWSQEHELLWNVAKSISLPCKP